MRIRDKRGWFIACARVDRLLSAFTDPMTGHNLLREGGFTRAY